MLRVASSHNPRFKTALRLHSNRGRKEQDRILIYGEREIQRAVAGHIQLRELFLCSQQMDEHRIQEVSQIANRSGAELIDLTPELFEKLAFGDRAETYLAIADRPVRNLANLNIDEHPLVLVIEAIEKPGNLGALFRSADGAGVSAVIVANPRTDLFHPNSIRASLGTVFSVPAANAESQLARDWLLKHQFHIWRADPGSAVAYWNVDFTGRTAIVLGSEALGISSTWQTDQSFSLPMEGIADSLNISVTAAIVAYESLRQRRQRS